MPEFLTLHPNIYRMDTWLNLNPMSYVRQIRFLSQYKMKCWTFANMSIPPTFPTKLGTQTIWNFRKTPGMKTANLAVSSSRYSMTGTQMCSWYQWELFESFILEVTENDMVQSGILFACHLWVFLKLQSDKGLTAKYSSPLGLGNHNPDYLSVWNST